MPGGPPPPPQFPPDPAAGAMSLEQFHYACDLFERASRGEESFETARGEFEASSAASQSASPPVSQEFSGSAPLSGGRAASGGGATTDPGEGPAEDMAHQVRGSLQCSGTICAPTAHYEHSIRRPSPSARSPLQHPLQVLSTPRFCTRPIAVFLPRFLGAVLCVREKHTLLFAGVLPATSCHPKSAAGAILPKSGSFRARIHFATQKMYAPTSNGTMSALSTVSAGPDCHDARFMCEGVPCAAEVRPFDVLLCPDLCLCCVSTSPRPRRIFWGGRRSKSTLVHTCMLVLGMHPRECWVCTHVSAGYAPT